MSTSEVISSIFFATNKLFRVKKLAIIPGPNFVNNSRLKINKNSTRNILSRSSITEECTECIVSSSCLLSRHLSILLKIVENFQNISDILPKFQKKKNYGLMNFVWKFTWIPCSRQYSSQQEFPTWIPAWPMWIEMHSLILRLLG